MNTKRITPEPEYRSFENRSNGGSMMDEQEKRLLQERIEWQRRHPKPWYLKRAKGGR